MCNREVIKADCGGEAGDGLRTTLRQAGGPAASPRAGARLSLLNPEFAALSLAFGSGAGAMAAAASPEAVASRIDATLSRAFLVSFTSPLPPGYFSLTELREARPARRRASPG